MVRRILEQEEAIRIVLSADRKTSHLILTWQDVDVLQSIHKALSPVSSLTDILSGDTYATVSAVLPIVHLIDTKLLKEMDEDSQLTKDIKHRIKQDLQTRYTEIKLGVEVMDILKVASVLDPRFKMKYVTDDIAMKENIVIECSGLGPLQVLLRLQ